MPAFPHHRGVVVHAPGDVTSLSVQPISTTALQITFGAVQYTSYYEERHSLSSSPGSWTTPATIVSGDSLTGLSSGVSYDVQVRAVNGQGQGAFSSTVSNSTFAAPGDISDLVVNANSDSSILDLVYTPSANATSHEERHSLHSSPGSWTTPATISGDQITGLTAATSYDVQIRGVNAAANGNFTSTVTTSTGSGGAIGNITDLVGGGVDTNTLSTTFTNASGATTHEYRYAPRIPQKSGGSAANLSTGLWSAPATLSGSNFDVPLSGHQYDIQVRGANGVTKGAWSNTSQGSTTAAGNNVNGAATVTPSGNSYTDGVIFGGIGGSPTKGQWTFSGSPKVISYSFPQAASNYGGSYSAGEPSFGFVAFNESQANAVRRILFMYQMSLPITFEEITETDSVHAILRYAFSSLPETAWGYYPTALSAPQGGDCWFGTSHGYYTSPQEGNYAFLTMIHETGHALGLKHPHESYPSFGAMPTDKDWMEWTVMTYRSFQNASTSSGYTNAGDSYATSPMVYDINSLQYMYGERTDMATGDNTYSFSATTGQMSVEGVAWAQPNGNKVFRTLWDSSGSDTLDMSTGGYSPGDSTLSNTAGSFSITKSSQLANLGGGHISQGNVYNPLDSSATIETQTPP